METKKNDTSELIKQKQTLSLREQILVTKGEGGEEGQIGSFGLRCAHCYS